MSNSSSRETADGYDLAISFLAADELIAAELDSQLEGTNVFFFPRKQEELAGTDGLESMRTPFLNCRVVVVLFRDRWGRTPWTGVEAQAIKDHCLRTQFKPLMFVQLEKSAQHPDWVPATHVRFNLSDFGMEQLVGAIKARLIENGGKIAPLDPVSKARRVKAEVQYLADRENLMRDSRWIADTVHRTVRAILEGVVKIVQDVNAESGYQIKAGTNGSLCVLRSDWLSMTLVWRQSITNSLFDEHGQDCGLWVSEFSGLIALPNEKVGFAVNPTRLRDHKFKPDVSMTRDLVFKEVGKSGLIFPDELPGRIVNIFLELVARAARKEIEPPYL